MIQAPEGPVTTMKTTLTVSAVSGARLVAYTRSRKFFHAWKLANCEGISASLSSHTKIDLNKFYI